MSVRRIAILGSTGSVGKSTLDVISKNRDKFDVIAIGARKSVDDLIEQVKEFSPKYVVITDEIAAKEYFLLPGHFGNCARLPRNWPETSTTDQSSNRTTYLHATI